MIKMSTKREYVENLKVAEILQAIEKVLSQEGYCLHHDNGSFHYYEILSEHSNNDTIIWGFFNNNKPTLIRFVNHIRINILKDNNKFGDEQKCNCLDEETIKRYTKDIYDIKNIIILFDFTKTRYTKEDKYLLDVIKSGFKNYGNKFYESLLVVFFNAHKYRKINQPVYNYNSSSDKLEFDNNYKQKVEDWYFEESNRFKKHFTTIRKNFVNLLDNSTKYTEISDQKYFDNIRYCYVGSIKNDILPIRHIEFPFGLDSKVKLGLREFFDKNKDTEWFKNFDNILSQNCYKDGLFCQVVDYSDIKNIRSPLIGTRPDRSLRSKCRKYRYSILGIIISCSIFTPMFIWFYSFRSKPTVGSGIGILTGTFIISVIGAIVINNWNSCDSSNGRLM